MLAAASTTDTLVLVLVFLFAVAVCILHVLWALRVMRGIEAIARAQESLPHLAHLGPMATAIVAAARHIRGEPDPAPPRVPASPLLQRPRHSPKI
jgi:hypothetical protein